MIDIPLLREFTEFGIGAVFAVVMFFIYRADVARHVKSVEAMNHTLLAALDANTRALLGVQAGLAVQSERRDFEDEMRELRELVRQQRKTGDGV